MSRRSRTTLVLSVRIPVPAGKTQKETAADVLLVLHERLAAAYPVGEMQVKIERRETVYL